VGGDKGHLGTVTERAAAPIIAKYTGVLLALLTLAPSGSSYVPALRPRCAST